MRWGLLIRWSFFGMSVLILAGSLLAILITGPVVMPPKKVEPRFHASPARLRAAVETLCLRYSPRDYRHQENLDAAAEWIGQRFDRAGLTVEVQEYAVQEGRFRNVVGLRRGSDPDAGAIVIGAHYDAYGEFPGADDNASGVAVLLELVASLSDQVPPTDQYFVAFSTEEPPFFGGEDMGSVRFAASLAERGRPVELMIALDLVGFYADSLGSQKFPFPGLRFLYPWKGNFVSVVGDLDSGPSIRKVKLALMATRGIAVRSFRAPDWIAGVHWSDHASFRALDMPGVLVTDTAFMRNPNYHEAGDTPETLDYVRMAHLAEALGTLIDPETSPAP